MRKQRTMEESRDEKSPKRAGPSKGPNELFVSETPGNSSSGYANTFRILENQIKRKKAKPSGLLCTSLCSISEEEPSFLELELAARSRLTELCDTNVVSSKSLISLNTHLKKFDSVQNYIYHVSKSRSGALTLKPKHLPSTSSVSDAVDNYGKLNFLRSSFVLFFPNIWRPCVGSETSENIKFSHFLSVFETCDDDAHSTMQRKKKNPFRLT